MSYWKNVWDAIDDYVHACGGTPGTHGHADAERTRVARKALAFAIDNADADEMPKDEEATP